MHVILDALANSPGLTITADYLIKEFLNKNKLQRIWEGKVATENTLFLAYDKSKVSTEQLNLARMLFQRND